MKSGANSKHPLLTKFYFLHIFEALIHFLCILADIIVHFSHKTQKVTGRHDHQILIKQKL